MQKSLSLKDHPLIKGVREKLRVQKVVATRSVKGRGGDHYVGYSAAWDSLQDDAGGASGLISAQADSESSLSVTQAGLSLKEAKIASFLLGMQADLSAHRNAWAGGNATDEQLEIAVKTIQANYGKLLMEAVKDDVPSDAPGNGS